MADVPTNEPSAVVAASQPLIQGVTEDLGHYYGAWGPFQRHVFYFMLLVFFVSSLHTLLTPAFIRETNFWCARPQGFNLSQAEWLKTGVPTLDDGSPDRCHMYADNGSVVACRSWEYEKGNGTRTYREEFNMVCQQQWRVGLTHAVFLAGGMASNVFSGTASDFLGRQPVILVNIFVLLSSGLAVLFIQRHFFNFLAWRFFVAFGVESLSSIGIITLAEILSETERPLAVLSLRFVWGMGFLILIPLVIYFDNWTVVQYFILLPTALLVVGLEVVLESPRWLLATHDTEGARAVILFAARKNHMDVGVVAREWKKRCEDIAKEVSTTNTYVESAVDSSGHRVLVAVALLCLSWLLTAFIISTLTLNWNVSNRYYDFASDLGNCAVQLAAFVLAVVTVHRFGCRWSSSASVLSAGLVSLPASLLYPSAEFQGIFFVCTVTSRVLVTAASSILCLRTLEIFPTVFRGRGLCVCAFFAKMGDILSMYGINVPQEYGTAIYVLFASLCIIDCAFLLWLPETVGKIPPDRFLDLEVLLGFQKASPRRSTGSPYETCPASPKTIRTPILR